MKDVYGPLPRDLTFGHEMCGRVERLGAGVTVDSGGQPLREGDRVASLYFFPCGRCPVCLRDEMRSCPRKGRANRVAGTPPYFNNAYGDYYYLRPGASVFRIPHEISDDIATPANCALAQVIYGLTRAGLRQDDTAVIQGAGGLGRFPFARLVSHVFPLARISDAFQQADWMQRGGDGLRISRAALSMTD